MKTVAFVVDAIHSHLYASIGLARRLQSRGYDVQYWGIARNGSDSLVREQGIRFYQLAGLWSRFQEDIRLPTNLTVLNAAFRLGELARRVRARRLRWRGLGAALDEFEAALDERLRLTPPDFVVVDPFLLAYYPFFHRRRVPTVVLSTKPLPTNDPLVPPYDSWLIPTDSRCGRLRVRVSWLRPRGADLLGRAMRRLFRVLRVYTYHDILLEAARRTAFPLHHEHVRRWVHPDLHFTSVHEWALWTPEIDLPRQQPLPSNVRYVGPSVDVGRVADDAPVRKPPGAKYFIYVAVGTVRFRWKDNVPFLAKVIRAFADVPEVFLAISTGDERATQALGTPPANVRIFDLLPQLRMLELADLVITHAGAGTYRECIARAVPMLAYPRNHDQIGNSTRIVHHRIGLRGDRKRDNVADIRRKVLAILQDRTFRLNLQHLRETVCASEEQLLSDALQAVTSPDTRTAAAGAAPRAGTLLQQRSGWWISW